MATIVLGGIGAAIGSVIPGVGTQWGWALGSMLGGMYDQKQRLSQMELGKLSDRTVSGSAYGAGIPIIWGRWRVGGSVVWVAKDSSGNHLEERGGGGGGCFSAPGGSSYQASCAVIFCAGELAFPGGGTVHRNPVQKKLWGDDILVYEAGQPSRYVLGSSLYWFDGSLSQAPNSVIVAREGLPSGDVVAYSGRAGNVMADVSLDDWGNRIPAWTSLIETDPVIFQDVFEDICRMKGLTAGEIDGSLGTMVVRGCCLMDSEDPLDLLLGVAQHFACDLVEIDGVLSIIPRGASPILTVPEIELGTSSGNGQTPRMVRRRPAKRELPSRVEVRFLDYDADLQTATQADVRPEGSHHNTLQVDVPLVLTADEGAQRAARDMDQAWEEADEFEIQLPLRRIALMPSDVLLLPTIKGLERVRVTKAHADPLGEVKLSAVAENPEAFTQAVVGSPGGQVATPPGTPVPTEFMVWSGRELQDAHQGSAGFYVAGSGGAGWQGGTIYWSPDSGTTWILAGSVTTKSAFGEALGALSSFGAVANTFDTSNTVQVDISDSGEQLVSATDTEILAGKNHAVLGSEILSVGIVSVVSPGVYTLSRLRRGQRGTAMSGHSIGERFVLIGSGTVRVVVPDAQIGATLQVKVVSPGQVLSDVTAESVVIAAPTPQTLDGLGVAALEISDVGGLQAALDGKQPIDPDLSAIAGLSTTGLIARTGAGTVASRTIEGTANRITVSNGDGASANPSITLPGAVDVDTSLSAGVNGVTNGSFYAWSSLGQRYAFLANGNEMRLTSTAGSSAFFWSFWTRNAGGTLALRMRLDAEGRLLLGTATGSARHQVRGLGTSSGLTALFEDSTGGALMTVRDDGAWALKGGTVAVSETGWSITNHSARRTFDTTTVTLQQLAEVVGTVILALRDKGVIRS
jgi:hypothetical protein